MYYKKTMKEYRKNKLKKTKETLVYSFKYFIY